MGNEGSGLQIGNFFQANNVHPQLTMSIALQEKKIKLSGSWAHKQLSRRN